MSTKVCTKCLRTKPLEAFYVNPRSKDGRRSDCRECGLLAKAKNSRGRRGSHGGWKARNHWLFVPGTHVRPDVI